MSAIWTADETARLAEMAGRASVLEIAAALGRSERAVRSKLSKIGASAAFKTHPWTGAEQRRLIDRLRRGITKAEAEAEFGRSGWSLKHKRLSLQQAGGPLPQFMPEPAHV